jgi:hypothetical protein
MAKVKQARQRLDAGVRDDPGLTVERLLEDWLNVVVSARAGSPNTISNYSQVVRLHLVPVLGRHKVRDLTPQHVDALLKAKADSGLSKNYVTRIRSVLADAAAGEKVSEVASVQSTCPCVSLGGQATVMSG